MAKDPLKDYLAHCYLYYSLNESVIADTEFDKLCVWIQKHWEDIMSPYRDLVFNLEKGELEGIKGSDLGDSCPDEIKEYANGLLAEYAAERELFKDELPW